MALVGQVREYVDGKADIASYIERVELYFAANYVKADYKVATFIAFIGSDAYGVLRNLLAPERPKYVFCAIVWKADWTIWKPSSNFKVTDQ